jgi:hypothetical protein
MITWSIQNVAILNAEEIKHIYLYNIVITVTVLDIIHRPVVYLKYNHSETGFCHRLQEELTELGQIDVTWSENRE